jgi:hypothetical protein
MFLKYTFCSSEEYYIFYERHHYLLEDTLFEAKFTVDYHQKEDIRYYSSLYYEIGDIYEYVGLDFKSNIQRLFMSEYNYSLERRGIDIRKTGFFKHCGVNVDKVLLLL